MSSDDYNNLQEEHLHDAAYTQQIISNLSYENKNLTNKNTSLTNKNTALLLERDKLLLKISSFKSELQSLKHQLALLKNKQFGSKSSEKLSKAIDELEHKIEEKEELEASVDNGRSTQKETNNKQTSSGKNKGRKALPSRLHREEEVISPESCPSCESTEFRKIGEATSEVLEYIPSSFIVKKYVRTKCVCKKCDAIFEGEVPSKPITKGKAGSGLLAHILLQKYCYHLPLYRQSEIYALDGIELSRSTMASWAGKCSKLLELLFIEIEKYVLAASEIHGDDTPVRVLAAGAGKTKQGRIWVYVKDGRPHSDSSPPAAIYYYSPDRKGERPQTHLKDFKGVLHADAYAGYNKLYEKDKDGVANIFEASCWAHTRRKFYEVIISNPNAKIASHVLELIGDIYKCEKKVRGESAEIRLKMRQEESKKIVNEFFVFIKKSKKLIPKKSPSMMAINYALNNEDSLKRFLNDGKIEIDNNAAERALRPIAVGRKNWLFAGSDNGGRTAAIMYSIIETAKMNGVNPYRYLRKVIDVMQDYNTKKLDELLPWNINLDSS